MVRLLTILFFIFFSSSCSANEEKSTCSKFNVDQLFGTYKVVEYERYRGGLTTESNARERLGKTAVVEGKVFKVRKLVISDPSYKITCHEAATEGNVDENRFSNFYGFALERKSIDVLEVYSPKDAEGEPSIALEIVNNQLWELYDGWLYKMAPLSESQ